MNQSQGSLCSIMTCKKEKIGQIKGSAQDPGCKNEGNRRKI